MEEDLEAFGPKGYWKNIHKATFGSLDTIPETAEWTDLEDMIAILSRFDRAVINGNKVHIDTPLTDRNGKELVFLKRSVTEPGCLEWCMDTAHIFKPTRLSYQFIDAQLTYCYFRIDVDTIPPVQTKRPLDLHYPDEFLWEEAPLKYSPLPTGYRINGDIGQGMTYPRSVKRYVQPAAFILRMKTMYTNRLEPVLSMWLNTPDALKKRMLGIYRSNAQIKAGNTGIEA